MCNRRVRVLSGELSETEDTQVEMDSPNASTAAASPGSVASTNGDNPRLKFLCSFNGRILPRPQDGRLRYVGGETRIVSVPRDIGFEDLMGRMKELFEGASVLKYQQPDEDLDALVSVVNDDDVINMMEEYDKLGSGDGFTRLRIFLFSNAEQDDAMHFVDGDERDKERRYVDALNSLNDSPDFGRQQMGEFQVMAPVDDIQLTEQYFNQLNLEGSIHNQRNFEGSIHNQRNFEMPMTPVNLRHLTIPQLGSLQRKPSVTQMCNEMESPWSPAYYSPRHFGNDFPASPSSMRYHTPFGEPVDTNFDRVPSRDYFRQQQVNHQPPYDHPSQLPDNVVWLPPAPISGDKAGFPGNILHGSCIFEGNNVCEHCRLPFSRNQAPDSPNVGNGFHQVANPCVECPPGREAHMANAEMKPPHPFYSREQNEPRFFYNEAQPHERGWVPQHHSNPRIEETRPHHHGGGRLGDHYIVDSNSMNAAVGQTAYQDAHQVPPHYAHHEERPRYVRHGPEFGKELFHDQPMATGCSHVRTPHEERGVRYGNLPYAYGHENIYHASPHGHAPANAIWRNVQSPKNGPSSYEASGSAQQENGTCNLEFIRTAKESSPRFHVGVENENLLVESSPKVAGFDGAGVPDYSPGHVLKVMPNAYNLENHHHTPLEPVQLDPVMVSHPAPILVDDKVRSLNALNTAPRNGSNIEEPGKKVEEDNSGIGKESNGEANVDGCGLLSVPGTVQKSTNSTISHEVIRSNCSPAKQIIEADDSHKDCTSASPEKNELEVGRLNFIPQHIESVKKAALEGVEKVKAEAQEEAGYAAVNDAKATKEIMHESDPVDVPGDLELDSDGDSQNNLKIEPTKAEEEAITRGLQTIRNNDLEEVKQLGSGTYGAVYHGKWKGSDVAIKRIKASCFAGRPSERERLIADFWKEALILGSLHHPNVVSFYGIVRDGPDGSLATVTEYMVNGSLKQFLQKKDRTIDRRKRLIIAMDASFGMEYLHEKNIVHFDLKCENLLVNMRDPHRPICKIGDLGLSKVKQHTLVSGGVRGTLPWMAPELLSGKSHMVTEKIDVYSFGIVMWELLTGDEPYGDMHCASIIGGIVNDSLRPAVPTWCDPEWKSLMSSCWSADPTQRPSFSEISHKLRTMAAAINVK